MSPPAGPLPGFDLDLAEAVFVSNIGHVPPYAAANLESFFVAIHRCCVDWLTANKEIADQAHATAFVLSERAEIDPALEEEETFTPFGRMDRDPPVDLPGRIIVASRNLRLTFARVPSQPNVKSMVGDLKALALGGRPTAIFVPAEKTLTVYRRGVDDEPTSLTDMEALAQLNPADLTALLVYFHENWTRYPDGRGACWDNAGNRVVEKNAERNIRNALYNLLALGIYRGDYVVRELQLPNGRADICILGYAAGNPNNHRVIELKVLRSRPSGWAPGAPNRKYSRAHNERYIRLGLLQAGRYRTSSAAVESHLACFDAQLEDDDIDVADRALELGVTYHRFFMESSVTGA